MDLQALRAELDGIDKELLALYLRRMEIVGGIARYKIEKGLPIFQPKREAEILSRVEERAGDEMARYACRYFETIMETSRAMQQELVDQKDGGS